MMQCVRMMRILRPVCSGVFQIYGKICCYLGRYPCYWNVCSGVCHNGSGRNWSFYHMRNGIRKTCEMTLSGSYMGHGSCCSYSCGHGSGSRATESWSVSVFVMQMVGMAVMSGRRPPASVISASPAVSWCAWWQNFIWAVHGYMAIIITVITPYVGAVTCHMAHFLALETPVIVTWHGVDWWCG